MVKIKDNSEELKVLFRRLLHDVHKILIDIKETFISKSFLEFCLLGCINCFNDSLFSWLARLIGLQKNAAAVVGYAIALTIAFLMTSFFIFKTKPTFKKWIKFLISYIPNFIIFFLVTFVTINTWHLHQFIGTFIAAVAGGPITFVIIKLYAFSNKTHERKHHHHHHHHHHQNVD